MLKSIVNGCVIMKVVDNKIESKTGGEPIQYKTCCFFHDMDSYTMTIDKSAAAKLKAGIQGNLVIGWDCEKRNGFSKYKPKIYDFNEMK